MAQSTYTVDNQAGALVRQRLNNIFEAIQTSNAGATAPTETAPGMLWLDTGVSPPVLRRRNAADDAWLKVAPDSIADFTLTGPGLVGRSAAGAGAAGLLNSAAGLTDAVAGLAALATPSGASNWAPDWEAFISADWEVTANRTLSNPTNVTPGTTRVVRIRSSSSTGRTISYGSNFYGDLNGGPVTDDDQLVLSLFAVASDFIVVSALEVDAS